MTFDNDTPCGALPDNTSAQAVRARLKWFNEPKGFGFVVLENGNIDAFLHITTLQRAGVDTLQDGACLLCHVEQGPKGAQVRQIVSLLEQDAVPPPAPANGTDPSIIRMTGAIKWYKPEKGFGFVTPDDGMKDVFIHKTCLENKGLEELAPGVRLGMTVRVVSKGREVIDFDILPSGETPATDS